MKEVTKQKEPLPYKLEKNKDRKLYYLQGNEQLDYQLLQNSFCISQRQRVRHPTAFRPVLF